MPLVLFKFEDSTVAVLHFLRVGRHGQRDHSPSNHPLSGICSFFPKQFTVGVLNSFLRCVRPLCHCWCPPFSAGDAAFLFICLPGLSLVVSAPGHVAFLLICCSFVSQVCHCWCPPFSAGPCSISIYLSPRSVAAGVRPFPLAM